MIWLVFAWLNYADESICKPLEIIFKSCLSQGVFPAEWKKANVVPVYKKRWSSPMCKKLPSFPSSNI